MKIFWTCCQKLQNIDLTYFDPHYCDSHADYQGFYHLLETYTEYWKDKKFVNGIKCYEVNVAVHNHHRISCNPVNLNRNFKKEIVHQKFILPLRKKVKGHDRSKSNI